MILKTHTFFLFFSSCLLLHRCPIDRLSSPPDLSGTGSRRNSRESRRGSKDSQRSSRRDSTNSECENMFLSLAVEECLAMSGGN